MFNSHLDNPFYDAIEAPRFSKQESQTLFPDLLFADITPEYF